MAEETLYDSEAMRRFAGIELGDDRIHDERTILHFRHLLERHGLTEAIFAVENAHLADKSITLRSGTLRSGTLVDATMRRCDDATMINAPSSTKNKALARNGDEFVKNPSNRPCGGPDRTKSAIRTPNPAQKRRSSRYLGAAEHVEQTFLNPICWLGRTCRRSPIPARPGLCSTTAKAQAPLRAGDHVRSRLETGGSPYQPSCSLILGCRRRSSPWDIEMPPEAGSFHRQSLSASPLRHLSYL